MEIDNIKQYKKLTQNGIPRKYKVDDTVLYRDKLFTLILTNSTAELEPPTKRSKYWMEVSLPDRLLVSTTKPVGIKFLGDRWYNPTTTLIYTYVKNDDYYIWLSN